MFAESRGELSIGRFNLKIRIVRDSPRAGNFFDFSACASEKGKEWGFLRAIIGRSLKTAIFESFALSINAWRRGDINLLKPSIDLGLRLRGQF
jgi:hypothetical protein